MRAFQQAVTTTPAKITLPQGTTGVSNNVLLKNVTATTVYIGGSSAQADSATDGFPIAQNESIAIDVAGTDEVWIATDSSSTTVQVLARF